jgi:outer membrane protein OmpA-like peptidoglycan-associated protein
MFRENIFDQKSGGEWISISDLMAALMMIFLFIAISYMNSLQIRAKQIKKIAVAYQELQDDLYYDLNEEFKDDLPEWKAEIDRETLSVKFHEPDVLFEQGRYEVTQRFQEILQEFFPRYLHIMHSKKYQDSIEEIRIEGHTSSEWIKNDVDNNDDHSYFLNMWLSQNRTRSVLEYCLGLITDNNVKIWSKSHITANGLSSSHLIFNMDGSENKEKSRRVEFRTKTAAEKKVVEIIEEMKES